jgi:beta-N-acetylhexosaminidase
MKFRLLIILTVITVVIILSIFINRVNKKTIMKILTFFPTPTLTSEQIEEMKTDEYIQSNMSSMTLDEKIGQLFIWGIGENKLSSLTSMRLGNLHAGGVIIMGSRNMANLTELVKKLKSISMKIPMFISIDQEGGTVKRLVDDQNPGPWVLGRLEDHVICEYQKNTDQLLNQAGVNLNFGIVGDIGWFKNGFITPRTYADDPDEVVKKVDIVLKCSPNVLTSIKHFPGHGRTQYNSHNTIPKIDIAFEDWEKTDLLPFKKAIDDHIQSIMIGHLMYEKIASEPATLSDVYPKILRGLGFVGLIITDDLGMLEDSGFETYGIVEKALNSGNDILMFVGSRKKYEDIYSYAMELVNEDKLKEEEINNRVRRILRIKYQLTKEKGNINDDNNSKLVDYIVITETPIPTPTFTPSPTPRPISVYTGDLENLFIKYSNQYSVSRDLLKKIADCESHFHSNSVNGPYGGMYQFHEGTWINVRKMMNENTDPSLRFNAEEAIKTAAFKISVGGVGSWPNCSK